jgi:hypothetical protein
MTNGGKGEEFFSPRKLPYSPFAKGGMYCRHDEEERSRFTGRDSGRLPFSPRNMFTIDLTLSDT